MNNRSALITGGSKGIGFSTAEALLKAGWQVSFTARTPEAVEQAQQRLSAFGTVQGLVADVREYDDMSRAVEQHIQRFGNLGVLVANAGVGRFGNIATLSPEQWHEVIDTNLTGVFYSVKACLAHLTQGGYIFIVSSLAGKNPFSGGTAYNASKFGLNGFSEALMLDVRPLGIKVTQIMPGSVATHFNGSAPSEQDAWKIQPEDIAQNIMDLLNMPERTLPSRVEIRPSQPKKH